MKKRFFYLFPLFILLLSVVCSCKDDNNEPTPPEPSPEITIPSSENLNPVLSQEGGTVSISFTATADWTASLVNTRAESWIAVTPSSGSKGKNEITITTTANESYDERNATVVLKCGSDSKNIVVTQKQKDALTVTSSKYEVASKGGNISVEVKANINFEVEARADWIKQQTEKTRALTTSNLNFTIEPNETGDKREGEIIIKSGELSETIKVYQGFEDFITLTKKDFTIPEEGGNVDIEIKSTLDYEVKMLSDIDWITEIQSRAVSTHTHHYTISPNETYDSREAKIVFYNPKDENVADTVSIYQMYKGAILIARNEYQFGIDGGTLNLAVQTNLEFDVEVSDTWIQQVQPTRALTEYNLSFAISKNTTIEKIRILSEQYASKTGLSVGKNGELVGDTSGLNNVQKAYLDEYNKKLIELKSTLLQLLPEWEKIFGDKEQRSFSDLKEAERIAREIKNNAKVSYDSDGKPNGFTSFFTKDDGSIENVKGAYSLLDKLIKAIPQLQDAQLAVNPFKTLAKNVKELFTSEKDSDKLEKKIGRLGESAAESADLVGNFAGQMSSMFDALGNEGMADTMGNVQDAMSSISNIGQGFAKGGIVGGIAAAAGEAVNWIGKIAQAHDKKLDKAIEKSKLRAQQLQYIYEQIDGILERFLGSGTELKLVDAENDRTRLNQLNNQIGAIRNKGKINIFDLMSLQKYKQEAEKLQKRVSAYDEGGAYGYQRALMQEQLSELEKQRQAEIDKKKTDDSKVADYENQIAEMKQQIKDFAEETAESLYGINLKDWASQLGDALYEAWQKGEDGAEAFKNKVADIMGDVMNSILKISILEPAMQQLQKMLFGEDGMSGYFGKDFSLDEKELESIADYLMGVSEKTDDYYSMLDKLNNYMEKKYGISMKEEEEDSGSGLSKGIQNVTENTANLLASYINAIRADVSVKREYVRRLVEELFPAYNVIAQAQLQQLTMIQINTAKNVEFVEEIRDILHRNINGVNKFNI